MAWHFYRISKHLWTRKVYPVEKWRATAGSAHRRLIRGLIGAPRISRYRLQTRIEALEKDIEESEERHEKAVPILTRVVEEMHTLTPKEQNDLLKMIVDRITYKKTESGAGIKPELEISLKI